jgi:hypothetical protein
MLDGGRYFAEFPDEDPNAAAALSPEALTALVAIEREISTFIGTAPKAPDLGAASSRTNDVL